MRNPRSPAWARSAVFAAALTFAVAGHVPDAAAQDKYQQLFSFGDSYADLTLSDKAATNLLSSAPPGISLSLWRVYPIPLAANLGIKDTQISDVAVGGATASPFGSPPQGLQLIAPQAILPGNLPQQVEGFLNTNPSFSFGPRDLVTINIGGNDTRAILNNTFVAKDPTLNADFGYPNAPINPLNAKDFAAQTTTYATSAIKALVDAGARTFVLGGFSTISGLPELQKQLEATKQLEALQLVPPGTAKFIADSADAYAKAYFEGTQIALAPSAQSGVRYFLFDLARLGAAVQANPAQYGFTGGFVCPPNGVFSSPDPRAGTCGATLNNPTNKNDEQSKYYFGPDGLHLTNAGFALVAEYMANIVMAPDTIAVQPGLVTTTTSGFASSLLNRLGSVRQLSSVPGTAFADPDGPMGLGRKSQAPRPAPASGVTGFAMGTFLGGSRDERTDLAGYEYDATAGTAGFEFSVNRNLIFGLAGNYTTAHADLTSGANIDVDSIQAAAYLSYATRHVFADALAAFGSHDVGLVRPGVLDPVRSDTDATAFALAARTGYLFDFGQLRAGPIAGLTYIHTRVGGYTEQGDPLLTFKVSAQTLDTLTGSVGLRFLAPFRAGGGVVIPYLNVTLEHQFGDDTHTLNASLTQAPLLPILSPVAAFDARTYGKVEGGITFQLGADLSASITGATTFARDEGEDHRFSAGLNLRF